MKTLIPYEKVVVLLVLSATIALVSGCASVQEREQNIISHEQKELNLAEPLSGNEGIIFGSWMNFCHDSEGNFEPCSGRGTISGRITEADKVDWTGSFGEKFLHKMHGFSEMKRRSKFEIKTCPDIPYILFATRLPAGEYSIFNIDIGQEWFKSDIRFSVIPGQITYIGSLQFNFYFKSVGKLLLSRLGGAGSYEGKIEIKDSFNKDYEIFKSRYPDTVYETSVELMIGDIIDYYDKKI